MPAPLDLDKRLLTSLMIMGSVVEARDAYTGGHLWRVGQFSRLLAEKAGLDRQEVFLAGLGGFMHDLGKVGVPDAVLNKPGALTDAEYGIIKTHPMTGLNVIAQHPLAGLVEDAVVGHHERPDGNGYPRKLPGDDIPLVARIIGITDAFDAMTSSRPYRRGMPIEKAMTILAEERGRQFDAVLTDAFLAIAASEGIRHVVGHSFDGAKMAECPMCGPIIATHGLADGHRHGCRSCGGLLRLHRHGDDWEAEATMEMAPPEMLAPVADLAPITDMIALAP